MRQIGASPLVLGLVAGLFVSPVWGRAHRFYHYGRAVVEKVSVEENGSLRELGANDVSPYQVGTRYVVVVGKGNSKYSGEFHTEGKNEYPITLRPGQKVSFRISKEQFLACDIHTVMTLVTAKYLVVRDPQGKDWDLFISGNLPSNFNAEIRQDSPFDGTSQH